MIDSRARQARLQCLSKATEPIGIHLMRDEHGDVPTGPVALPARYRLGPRRALGRVVETLGALPT